MPKAESTHKNTRLKGLIWQAFFYFGLMIYALLIFFWEEVANNLAITLSPPITFELLVIPRVLLYFIPVFVGLKLGKRSCAYLLKDFYEIAELSNAFKLLNRLLSKQTKQFGSKHHPLSLERDMFAIEKQKKRLLKIGGPGWVRIKLGDVAVTEWKGQVCRVLANGPYKLYPFEKVVALLDLQTQERYETRIPVSSKEGIRLHCDLGIRFWIHRELDLITTENPFPFEKETILNVAYAGTINKSGEKATLWSEIPIQLARRVMTEVFSNIELNDLLAPDPAAANPQPAAIRDSSQILIGKVSATTNVNPHFVVRQEIERKLRHELAPLGIELLSLHLGAFEFPDQVQNKNIDFWRKRRDRLRRESEPDHQAAVLAKLEMARVAAKINTLKTIVEGVEHVQAEGDENLQQELIASQLIKMLLNLAWQSQELDKTANEEIIKQLTKLLHQIADHEVKV